MPAKEVPDEKPTHLPSRKLGMFSTWRKQGQKAVDRVGLERGDCCGHLHWARLSRYSPLPRTTGQVTWFVHPYPSKMSKACSLVKQREISKFGETRQGKGWREAQNCSLNTAQWVSGSIFWSYYTHPAPRQVIRGFSSWRTTPEKKISKYWHLAVSNVKSPTGLHIPPKHLEFSIHFIEPFGNMNR